MSKKREPAVIMDERVLLALDRLHFIAAVTVFAVGSLVLVGGWTLEIDLLKRVAPGFVTMKVNTAISFILSGLSLLLWHGKTTAAHRAARVVGGTVALLGALNIAQYLWGIDLGIDQLLFVDVGSPFTSHPGRMSSSTAFSFLFTGTALALLPLAASECLTIAALLPPLMAAAGYLHHAQRFVGLLSFTGMAVHTLFAFLVLGLGILTARPRWGGGVWLAGGGPEGTLVRHYLPLAILMLFGICVLTQMGLQAKLLTEESRDALNLLTNCLAMGGLIFTAARTLARVDNERKSAEQALRESGQRLGLALAATGGGVWEWNLAEDSAWWSPEMYAVWGAEPGGRMDLESALEKVHPEDRERLRHQIGETIHGNGDFHCEFRINHPVRGEVWLASHGRAQRDAAGRALRLHGITEDVTKRRRAEDALREARAELEMRVEERTRELREAKSVLRGLNETLEQRIEERTAELLAANSRLEESRTVALKVMADALEARKQAENAGKELIKSNNRLDLLAQSAKRLLASESPQDLVEELCHDVLCALDCHAFFYYLIDPESDRLQLLACSGVAEEEKGKISLLDPYTTVCGRAVQQRRRVIAEDISAQQWPVAALAQSVGIRAYVCHPLISDGRIVGTLSFGTRTKASFEEEELALMQAVSDQVAVALERKRSEEELVQAKEAAEAASRTKSQFLANMSHELRTPMTGILGMIDLALNGPLEPGQRDFIEAAHTSAHSLIRILNDILDLTRIQSENMAIELQSFSLRDSLQRIVNLMLPVAKKKGLDLGLAVSDDVPRRVVGDEVRLGQVLTNLASNAVKFTDSGSVELSVTVGADREGGKRDVIFAVRDTGIGVPKEMEAALFRPFSQADASHTRKHGGAGLGLVICREIADKLGGTITYESEVGKGTTFYFTVPLGLPEDAPRVVAPAEEPAQPAPAPDSAAPGKRVLVVDDDAAVRQILKSMLEQMDFVVELAENGRDALEKVEKLDFDVILMDVQMPVMDGFAATRAIRSREEKSDYPRTPIIAVTAHAFEEDEDRCLAAGMDAYLSKPIDFKGTLQLINRLQREVPQTLQPAAQVKG